MHFNAGVYDVLKRVAQIWLPAAGTLYYTVAAIWGLPAAEEVVGTVMAVDTFLGIVLGISSASYAKTDKYVGTMNVSVNEDGKKTYSLDVDGNLEDLDQKDEIVFKVAS